MHYLTNFIENDGINIFSVIFSTIAALLSAYFALKSLQQNAMSQIPILEPEITSLENPHHLSLVIKNIGNGLAKNVKGAIPILKYEQTFDSDLQPRKYQDYKMFTWEINLPFNNGMNPLFENGELLITYEDIWGKKYSTRALFKPDSINERRLLGHIDKNFSGTFYINPY